MVEPVGASAVLFEHCHGAGLATTRAIRPDIPSTLAVLDLRSGAPVTRGGDDTITPVRTKGFGGLLLAVPRARRHLVVDGRTLSLQALTPGGLRSTGDSLDDVTTALPPAAHEATG